MKTQYFLGIDVGKEKFHAALTIDGVNFYDQEVANEPAAISSYFTDLKVKFGLDTKQLISCMEYTGIYSYPLLDYLTKKRIAVCVEPALRIKQSQGMQRGKNDKVDAIRIAKYLFKNHDELKFWEAKREVIQKLHALLSMRDRFVKAKNQLEVPVKESGQFIEKSIRQLVTAQSKGVVQAIAKGIKKVEAEISALIKNDFQLTAQVKIATSVTGVGVIIAAYMIVTTNEFQNINNHKQFACYSGIAPFPNQSGKSLRGRNQVSHLANKKIKTLLHLGARSAVQHSPEIKLYYQRKVSEGKAKLSVLNAVCNKLISRVFVCIKQQRMYEKKFQNALA